MFVCTVDAAAKAAFQPALNEEHREAKWWPLGALPPSSRLHPVVVSASVHALHAPWDTRWRCQHAGP